MSKPVVANWHKPVYLMEFSKHWHYDDTIVPQAIIELERLQSSFKNEMEVSTQKDHKGRHKQHDSYKPYDISTSVLLQWSTHHRIPEFALENMAS